MYVHNTYGLGALDVDWSKVREAARQIARGALDAAKERAARELLARVQGTPEYRAIEREIAAERARQLANQYLPLALGAGLLFLLLRK